MTVFLAHMWGNYVTYGVSPPVSPLIERLFLSGGRQVDLFFLLSGFILTLIYASWFETGVQRTSYLKFLRRRLARIYPLHLFVLLLVVGFVLTAYAAHIRLLNGIDRFTFVSLVPTALLAHAWGFAGGRGGPWNPPSWSVSIEALAYLLFPFFLCFTGRLRKENPWLIVLGVSCVGFTLNALFIWGLAGVDGIVRGLSEFALGCSLMGIKDTPIATWLRTPLGAGASLAILVICYALTPDTGFWVALCAAPLLLTLYGDNWLARGMGWGPIHFLGEISYSIYLGHFLYISILHRVVSIEWMKSSPFAAAAGMATIVAVVLGVSTLTYYAIERPGRDYMSGKRVRAVAPESVVA